MFAAIEAKIKAVWHDLTGDARAELETLLADAKAEEAKVLPLVTEFKADLGEAVKDLEPEVKAAVEALGTKLLADLAGILGSAA